MPFELQRLCSNTFWKEDSGVLTSSNLFHYIGDINGRHAAIIIDTFSWVNYVSIEVVEKLQLLTSRPYTPYRLATSDDALLITQVAYVPLTIYGHKVNICCHVIPRALNCCHLLLGKTFCREFKVNYKSHHSDLQLFWNNENTKLMNVSLKQFQEVRHDNLCSPIVPTIKLNEHVDIKES